MMDTSEYDMYLKMMAMEDELDGNGTYNATLYQDDWNNVAATIVIPSIFALISVIGIIGNASVVLVIVRNRNMRTVTNCYIMNNAITDILFLLICVPVTATQFAHPTWIFGDFVCKFVVYIQYVSVQVSCGTLTAMSIDRWQAILYPMESLEKRTTRKAVIISLSVWFTSFAIHIPVIFFFQVLDVYVGLKVCTRISQFSQGISRAQEIISVVLLFVLPFIIITYCYAQILRRIWSKRQHVNMSSEAERTRRLRVTRMTLIVVILFGICWGPIHVINLMFMLQDPTNEEAIAWYYFKVFCLCLAYSNAAMNPFVYAFSGRNYRSLCWSLIVSKRPSTNNNSRRESSVTGIENSTSLLKSWRQSSYRRSSVKQERTYRYSPSHPFLSRPQLNSGSIKMTSFHEDKEPT
ncbi:G-protein coupled receptor 54-like [Antedon mediterranea]|uniref:G-protein coupled receptor 54-like n=1 Tax=Antedon mediterranea TaxID=105859 RepID=UPI003AF58A99